MTIFRIEASNLLYRAFFSSNAENLRSFRPHAYRDLQVAIARDFCYLANTHWARLEGETFMARNSAFVKDMKFVKCELTKDEREACKKWTVGDDELIAYVEKRGSEGYKFGFRLDTERGNWIASVTCAQRAEKNYGWCLSAYGGSWWQALRVVAYKDVMMLDGDWAIAAEMEGESPDFG